MSFTQPNLKMQLTKILLEEDLKELFDSQPFKTSFKIEPGYTAEYETQPFQDEQGNQIVVGFISDGPGVFEIDFQINGNSFKDINVNYTITEYSKLLATVAQAVSQFIEEYKPYGILLTGVDDFSKIQKKPSTEGQKDRVYDYFISKMKEHPNYKVGRYPNGIGLQRMNKKE
jgi:hypothetical protein